MSCCAVDQHLYPCLRHLYMQGRQGLFQMSPGIVSKSERNEHCLREAIISFVRMEENIKFELSENDRDVCLY